ncbi:MAG: bifunctional phosphopantothenoylcysteine decarboxylase/phosphopantothenate--cysteine ligase CoaBC [Flavobacteriales bacterium]|nr:bifunctional phosphopantothenoylcysteine decarboxylase/phosphopantothenate--cysteine ligase CoaBC [Flavobacteriales bacterium]MDP4730634.1 bifunctional phosphopantothenoylcysteine decarboxylase/phosphopantothenate--cysteine ligase CoaBC [Flavobacteriales bacterium]
MLKGKKIVLAVTGSISAYKSLFLLRLLVKEGAEVKVIMSKSAHDFIQPLSFSALSKHPVCSDFTESEVNGVWNNHVEMALWADLILVAPCTANTLAKYAAGMCDSYLLAVLMSAQCPLFFAPAMDHDMMEHAGTQDNLKRIASMGCTVLAPGYGELASGLIGKGRLSEPEEILSAVISYFNPNQRLKGLRAMVNAGPTYEAIDPVRFIGNRSSGKMGIAIAQALRTQGADVTLVLGPVHESVPEGIKIIRVESAKEMFEACTDGFQNADIAVLAAAVADYRPANVSTEKIKKKDSPLELRLEETEDIAAALGKSKKANQKLICFALETENEEAHALSKLQRKNADMLVLNSLRTEGVHFGSDNNAVTLFHSDGSKKEISLKSKSEIAQIISNEIADLFQ